MEDGIKKPGRDCMSTGEIMNLATQEWSPAADLPGLLSEASVTICHDHIYTFQDVLEIVEVPSQYTCVL